MGASQVKPYLSVCAIYRDEADYLAEWIEFHLLVGVERFFLYDNMSVDHHREVLQPYIEQDIAIVHDWPDHPKGQFSAYTDCLERYRHDVRWIAFIDLDEFLFSPTGRPVSDVLIEYESAPGVGVNWAMFGTSGHRTKPEGLVIETHEWRMEDIPVDCPIKTIVDPTRTVSPGATVHFFSHADGPPPVNENHEPIDQLPRSSTRTLSYSKLRINHYLMKSEEEYRRKRARGRADADRSEPSIPDDVFRRREKAFNQHHDTTIQMYLPRLREALAARAQAVSPAGSQQAEARSVRTST
jgi:hypothetical protein